MEKNYSLITNGSDMGVEELKVCLRIGTVVSGFRDKMCFWEYLGSRTIASLAAQGHIAL